MIQRRVLSGLTGLLLLAAACSDQNEPVAPSVQPEPPTLQPTAQASADDPIALARAVPGFGGFYLDDRGARVVYLKHAGERSQAQRALAPFLNTHGLAAAELRVVSARYDWSQLEGWFDRISQAALGGPGAVFVDADEASNRVRIGVVRGAAPRIRGILARLGTPEAAVIIEETEPIRLAATLRSRVRPVVGGLQINFPGFLCSLGFNAIRNGQSSFITNSHCTSTQGGTEGTRYWEPTQSTAAARIGTEVNDPVYFRNTNGCPASSRCRFSDASRAAYAAGTTFNLGKIAKTTGANNGSLTISGSFNIVAEGSASVGQTVSKVGRTTGWTRGRVTNTCVNVGVNNSDIVQLCQNLVRAGLGEGDSGSPVFKGSTNVTLVGILWGSISNTQYVYSPMSNIERELGQLTTF